MLPGQSRPGLMFRSGMPEFFSRFFSQINFSPACAVTVALTHISRHFSKAGSACAGFEAQKVGKMGELEHFLR